MLDKRLARSSCVAALVAIGLSSIAAHAGDRNHFGGHGFGEHGYGDHEKVKSFNRVAFFPAFRNGIEGSQAVSEIVAASTDGKTLIYTDSARKGVGFVDIADPSEPKPLGFLPLNGEPTSVAVRGPYVLAAVDTSAGNFVAPSGKLDIIRIADRSIARTIDLGGQPDSIAISKDGRYGAIAMENQRDEDVNDGQLPQPADPLL